MITRVCGKRFYFALASKAFWRTRTPRWLIFTFVAFVASQRRDLFQPLLRYSCNCSASYFRVCLALFGVSNINNGFTLAFQPLVVMDGAREFSVDTLNRMKSAHSKISEISNGTGKLWPPHPIG